jgi:hypothetical protein
MISRTHGGSLSAGGGGVSSDAGGRAPTCGTRSSSHGCLRQTSGHSATTDRREPYRVRRRTQTNPICACLNGAPSDRALTPEEEDQLLADPRFPHYPAATESRTARYSHGPAPCLLHSARSRIGVAGRSVQFRRRVSSERLMSSCTWSSSARKMGLTCAVPVNHSPIATSRVAMKSSRWVMAPGGSGRCWV